MKQKFKSLYDKIADRKNYIQPTYARMDNWAVDRYETGKFFAGMADAGYTQWVGKFDDAGKVLWKVTDIYGKELGFFGITPEEFEQVTI